MVSLGRLMNGMSPDTTGGSTDQGRKFTQGAAL